jgi:hypothetical protein
MEVHRAPIQNITMQEEKEDKRPRTRTGYLVPEAYACYEKALGEVGTSASGKAMHFAADIVCSGGLEIWIRGVYSYSVQHIGLANPRIFVYLKQRISELDKKYAVLPQESFYSHPEVQSNIAECVLVLQLCPKRSKVIWPKVDDNTKRPGWLRGVAGSPETRVTRTVWKSDQDSPSLYLVSNEFCKAIQEGAQERALFWIKWTMEEDARVRKETKGSGLSTKERGVGAKGNTDAGHFMAAVLIEIYKELASSNSIRMNEEFGELCRLWRGGEIRMATNLRRDCLGLMALICCEVPRWKVPAAPSLVADPIRLSRAVGQSGAFFNEVLANPMRLENEIKPKMMKTTRVATKTKAITEKEKKELTMEEKFTEYDAIMEKYLSKF